MTESPSIAKINEFVQNEILADRSIVIAAEQDLLSTGQVDSMGVMRLITFLEEEFEIGVPPEDVTIDHFASLQSISEYVDQRVSDR